MNTHLGCRACGRIDVSLKKDETLRNHVHADKKGSSFLMPGSGVCRGTGHPPKGVFTPYTKIVVEMLGEEFPNLVELDLTGLLAEKIQQQQVDKSRMFEFLLDQRGDWRLRADAELPGDIRVACYRAEYETDKDRTREQILNHLINDLWWRPTKETWQNPGGRK